MLLDELKKLRKEFNVEVQTYVDKYIEVVYDYTVKELKRAAKEEGSNQVFISLKEAIGIKCLEPGPSYALLQKLINEFAKEDISINTNYRNTFNYDSETGDYFYAEWEL